MDERMAFLKTLAANEDDVTTRLVYADWLDEHGEHEEADRQRKWPTAKEWLVAFAERYNADKDEDDDYDPPISYKRQIEMGQEGLTEGEVFCGGSDDLCVVMEDASRDYWKNWSIVTGVPVPDGTAETMSYVCAC